MPWLMWGKTPQPGLHVSRNVHNACPKSSSRNVAASRIGHHSGDQPVDTKTVWNACQQAAQRAGREFNSCGLRQHSYNQPSN